MFDQQNFTALLKKYKVTISELDRVVEKNADNSWRDLVKLTPKRWTGDTRRAWRVVGRNNATYEVTNDSKVMRYLEYGTKMVAPIRAKNGGFGGKGLLYIPLKKSAIRYRRGLKFGDDFVLAKQVKGIIAKNIVKDYANVALRNLTKDFIQELRKSGA